MFVPDMISLACIAARFFGILVALPMSEGLTFLPRLFIAIIFGYAVAPALGPFGEYSVFRLIPEFLLGFLLGAPIRFAAEAAQMFGELLDTARGQTIGSIVDPLNGQQDSEMSSIARLGVVALALQMGALELSIDTLKRSYELLSLNGAGFSEVFLMDTVRRSCGLMTAAISLSAVWLVSYVMIDIFAALLSKVLQGLSFTSTAAIVKMIITMVLLLNLLAEPEDLRRLLARYVLTDPMHALGTIPGRGP